ncbi:MAG: ArsR/SmtB family transcription factor [Gemmatimonadaceae bacterium]
MSRTLELLERKPGERCCDVGARPSMSFADAEAVAADFDILAHPVRLQLLDVLARNAGRVCVCDLEAAVPVKQPTVSHHLRLLREAGLVDSEKVGVWAYYRVDRERLALVRTRLSERLRTLS